MLQFIQILTDNTTALVAFMAALTPILVGLWKLLKNILQMAQNIRRILEEVTFNGGESLKDEVVLIRRDLKLLAERQEAMLEHDGRAVLKMDEEGIVVDVNRTLLRWSGRAHSEVVGNGWLNIVHPDHQADVRKRWEAARELQTDLEMFFEVATISGDVFGVAMTGRCLRDSGSGEVLGWQLILDPIRKNGRSKDQSPHD